MADGHRDARPLYRGRFAPSPSGPLHNGSLLAAMASYLDARAHCGQWLLRIEDVDLPRAVDGADRVIMRQLQALGMHWDAEPVWQSQRFGLYESAFDALRARGLAYPCGCTRQELPAEGRYPGTCSGGLAPGRKPRSWRFRVPAGREAFSDRWFGLQEQDVQADIGDFIIKRADGYWAYQLAVVIDDGEQGITDIVRGADLLDSTERQHMLARALGYPCPRVMHVPLLRDAAGRKLSKQNHAAAMDLVHPLDTLNLAWTGLGFESLRVADIASFWRDALPRWAARFDIRA